MAEIFNQHFPDPFSANVNRSVVPVISDRCRLFRRTFLKGCAAMLTFHYPETFWQGESPAPGLGLPDQKEGLRYSPKEHLVQFPG